MSCRVSGLPKQRRFGEFDPSVEDKHVKFLDTVAGVAGNDDLMVGGFVEFSAALSEEGDGEHASCGAGADGADDVL